MTPRLLAEVLLAERPDVLCLQEAPRVWRSGTRLRRWADRAGMRVRRSGGQPGDCAAGLASGRGARRGDLDLPYPAGRTPRAAAWAQVDVAGLRATVVSVHLGLGAAERLEQAHVVRQATMRWPDQPLVIAGDLNERPTEHAFRVLAEGMQDAGAAEDAPTFPARGASQAHRRVLVDPRLRVVSCRTLDGLERATDHCPVIVDLAPA